MSIPKEPRMRMIMMMYLVLTALLALNISAEILNAFYLVNDGIKEASRASDTKNAITYAQIYTQYERDPARAQDAYDKSLEVKALAKELVDYITAVEEELIELTGGWSKKDTSHLESPKDIDKPSTLMINQGKGEKLQAKINEGRQRFLDILGFTEEDEFATQLALSAPDPGKDKKGRTLTWSDKYFDFVPAVACLTIFSSLKNDVKNAEADVITALYGSIGGTLFKVDRLTARAIAATSYITIGQEYTADIFVSASSKTQDPEVYIGQFDESIIIKDSLGGYEKLDVNPMLPGYDSVEVAGGIGKYTISPTTEGEQQYFGVIKVLNTATGETSYFPFEQKYTSAKGTVVVSPTKMNVLYIGLDNPLEISVPGFAANRITATISGGSLSKTGTAGEFIAKVRNRGTAKVIVSAELNDGTNRVMGDREFRVKRVPDPIPEIDGKSGGSITAARMRIQRGIFARLYNFDFDTKFTVLSFKLIYRPKGSGDAFPADVSSAVFVGRMKDFVKGAQKGDFFFFKDIKVRGLDGTTRTLNAISFEIL